MLCITFLRIAAFMSYPKWTLLFSIFMANLHICYEPLHVCDEGKRLHYEEVGGSFSPSSSPASDHATDMPSIRHLLAVTAIRQGSTAFQAMVAHWGGISIDRGNIVGCFEKSRETPYRSWLYWRKLTLCLTQVLSRVSGGNPLVISEDAVADELVDRADIEGFADF